MTRGNVTADYVTTDRCRIVGNRHAVQAAVVGALEGFFSP